MEVEMDGDVRIVLEFMQRNLPAARLVAVAEEARKEARKLAPILWGHYPTEEVRALKLRHAPPISADGLRTRSVASERGPDLLCADDDSEGVTGAPE
jgi:hypothetical protein